MDYLRTDQYTYINPNCPVRTDVHPVDDVVEVTLGEHRIGGDTLRLVLGNPEACHRLAQFFHEAGCQLTAHFRAKQHPDPALSQLDPPLSAPIAG